MSEHWDRALVWAAAFTVACCLLLPLSNPDLFWHLSAASKMLELRAIPSQDWLSWTRNGAPWKDFEWLPQLLYWLGHRAGSWTGLWLLKILTLSGALWALLRTLKLYGLSLPARAGAAAFWAAASLPRADLRPDLFSMIGFGLTFLALERRRLGLGLPGVGWTLALFCVWANLHPGFAYGLLLIGIYAVAELLGKLRTFSGGSSGAEGTRAALRSTGGQNLWFHLAAAILGTLLQPFGLGAYEVLWDHWKHLGTMAAYITEWSGIRLDNPWHWPTWVFLFAGFGAALSHLRLKRWIPAGPLIAVLYFGFSASRHARLAAYYVTLAVPLAFHWFQESGLCGRLAEGALRRAWAVLIAVCAAYTIWSGRTLGLFQRVYNDRFLPLKTAEFLHRERESLAGKNLYNPWGWGGYLGWRSFPDYKVFVDGRYIFHPILAEAARGVERPKTWQAFLDRYRVDVVLLENTPIRLPTTRSYPDGSSRPFQRPYYLLYMPKEHWAFIHWDERGLVFVRRSAFPPDWLKSMEYRYARPFDDEALADVLARNEIPRDALKEERRRHDRLLADLPAGLPR